MTERYYRSRFRWTRACIAAAGALTFVAAAPALAQNTPPATVVLAAPTFAPAAPAPPPPTTPLLRQLSSRPNRVSLPNDWLERNDLSLPLGDREAYTDPSLLPPTYGRLVLVRVIMTGDHILRIYGEDYASGALLVSTRTNDGAIEYILDFSSYQYAPEYITEDREFVRQAVWWAWPVGDTLYVSHGHNTYAKSSKGRNAYVSAIDTRSGRALWHSPALVSNSSNFEIVGNLLITGYGFTAEPDYLYVPSRDTGRIIERHAIKSGPDLVVARNDSLFVHTYNTDYVFELKAR